MENSQLNLYQDLRQMTFSQPCSDEKQVLKVDIWSFILTSSIYERPSVFYKAQSNIFLRSAEVRHSICHKFNSQSKYFLFQDTV